MKCPKCEEGTIVTIKFKKTGKSAFLCDFCQTVWFEGEDIALSTGHQLKTYTNSEDREYTLEEAEEKNQEHQPAVHKDYK